MNIADDSKIVTTAKTAWSVGLVIVLCASTVGATYFRLQSVELVASANTKQIEDINIDRTKHREEIMKELSVIDGKVEKILGRLEK